VDASVGGRLGGRGRLRGAEMSMNLCFHLIQALVILGGCIFHSGLWIRCGM
jgi:hypothetical protein